jgi:hypothetical protein
MDAKCVRAIDHKGMPRRISRFTASSPLLVATLIEDATALQVHNASGRRVGGETQLRIEDVLGHVAEVPVITLD